MANRIRTKLQRMKVAEIREKVKELLHQNMIIGHSKSAGKDFHYTKPSPDTYPFQYFWDTCFHIFTLTALGEVAMAKKHAESLFSLQDESGFVGHILYWNTVLPARITDIFQSRPGLKGDLFRTHMSSLLQPPLIAQAVLRIYNCDHDVNFLTKMLPKLKKYYRWIAENRDFKSNGLVAIISPFESGMDWKPTLDVVVGFKGDKANWKLFWKVVGVDAFNFSKNYQLEKIYEQEKFIVWEVGFNTIYIQNLQALSKLCEIAGDEESNTFKDLAERAFKSLLEIMYDEDDAAFYDVYGKKNLKIKVLTPTIFFPAVIDQMPDEIAKKVINKHLFNENEFKTAYPIPSLAVKNPSFNPSESVYIWRGPTWIFNNWFIHKFLMEKGFEKEAKLMVRSVVKLIDMSGFREYYNPFTGEGYGAKEFTWTGLVVDMLEMEKAARK